MLEQKGQPSALFLFTLQPWWLCFVFVVLQPWWLCVSAMLAFSAMLVFLAMLALCCFFSHVGFMLCFSHFGYAVFQPFWLCWFFSAMLAMLCFSHVGYVCMNGYACYVYNNKFTYSMVAAIKGFKAFFSVRLMQECYQHFSQMVQGCEPNSSYSRT